MIDPMIEFLTNFKQGDIEQQYRDYLENVRKMHGDFWCGFVALKFDRNV